MPVHMVRIESAGNGQRRRFKFHPAPSDDPAVRSRLECPGVPGEHEIATTFRSTKQRPSTYPEGLPFIPGVTAHTNAFPTSDRPSRVRWSTLLRSRRIFDEVVRQSIASGWKADPTIDPPHLRDAVRKQFFRRTGYVRLVWQSRFGAFGLIQLEHVPDGAMDRITGASVQRGS